LGKKTDKQQDNMISRQTNQQTETIERDTKEEMDRNTDSQTNKHKNWIEIKSGK
jgi:hypothetical protein